MKITIHEVIYALPHGSSPAFIKGTITTLWDNQTVTLILSDGIWTNAKTGQRMPNTVQAQIKEQLDTIASTPNDRIIRSTYSGQI